MTIGLPEEDMRFRSLKQEARAIKKMRHIYRARRKKREHRNPAFYFSYCTTHKNRQGVTTSLGDAGFIRAMESCIERAQEGVEMIAWRYLRPFEKQLATHNSVANCLNPIELFKQGAEPFPRDKSSISFRAVFDARRNFCIASQMFTVESEDPNRQVGDDLREIDRISWERLFVPGMSANIAVVSVREPAPSFRVAQASTLYTDRGEARRAYNALRKSGAHCCHDLYPCRIVKAGSKHFAVYAENRWKRPISTVMKLEANRHFYDRRGWKYVVVGVREHGKVWRAGTRFDANELSAITVGKLWLPPLRVGVDKSGLNPFSHDLYWDVKVLGRFFRDVDGFTYAPRLEQIVLPLDIDLSLKYSHEYDNHFLYKALQVYEHLAPRWFPHHGVNWQTQATRDALENWWKSQLL
ncbi:MAG: hypothetical protein ABIA47_04685 [bacterium]